VAGRGSTLPLACSGLGGASWAGASRGRTSRMQQAGEQARVEQAELERARVEQAFRPANSDTTHEGFSPRGTRGTYPSDSLRFGEVFHGKQLAMPLHDADTHHIHVSI
jgi:hypothetical protein